MTRESDKPTLVRKIVVVFDICSSTSLLEDLKSSDNLEHWRDLLIALKEFLSDQSLRLHFDAYKFIGDGWVLLFPTETSKDGLLDFISGLSAAFYGHFYAQVEPFLQSTAGVWGITVGVDSGELIRLEMNEQIEYLGRAINVATRLQTATKELSGGPADKALFSKNSFNSLGRGRAEFKVRETKVQLRNISNGQNYECFQWDIPL